MAIIGTQAIKIERSLVGGDPCTYAPTIVDGEMTWPGCIEKPVLAPVFTEAKYQHRPIGGNPNTWTPKHKPIGGNPNTWTPTHEIVGDNPCTYAPTIVDGKMTWPGCDEKNGLAQVFAEAKYCGNGWCESDDEQHMMGTDSDTYTPIHYKIMGDSPCTYAPTIVDGKMTWPGCDEKNGLAQVDAEAEASAESFGDGYNAGAFGGFAQIQSQSDSAAEKSDSGETDHDTGFFGRMEGDLEDLFAQTDAGFSFADFEDSLANAGFAQTDVQMNVTPGEETLGVKVGDDALQIAAASGKISPGDAKLGEAGIGLGVDLLGNLLSSGFAQTDADFGFGDIEKDFAGMFAQTDVQMNVTPGEEKLGMAVGTDALNIAAKNGKISPEDAKLGDLGVEVGVEGISDLLSSFHFAQTEYYDPKHCAKGMMC